MPFHVGIRTASGVAGVGQAFGIRLERLTRGKQVGHDIVVHERVAEAVVIRNDLTRG